MRQLLHRLFLSLAAILVVGAIFSAGSKYTLHIVKLIFAATTSWDFTNPSDYSFDSSKIEVLSGQAQLKETDNWYDASWRFRRAVIVDNSGGADTLTNYQTLVALNSTNFDFSKALNDGSDLRFTDSDGTTQIDHWIEKYDSDDQSARIWVKVPSISESLTKTIHLYYGNQNPLSYDYFKITVDSTAHNDYGLTYPVTYRFSVPPDSSGLKAYKRYSDEDPWSQLIEKTTDDFFNGIEAVRFDYANNKAYVSAAFGNTTDNIYLKITDSSGTNVATEYVDITSYYDNRDAAVVVSADDERDGSVHTAFMSAYQILSASQIWFTPAINTALTTSSTWADIQTYIDEGYLEPACHTRNHARLPYDSFVADSEIGGCKDDILNHLSVPFPKGSTEYVPAFVEPWGESDSVMRTALGQYKYLVSRSTSQNYHSYAKWSPAEGLFERAGTSIIAMGASEGPLTTLATLNARYDTASGINGIYHLWFHPVHLDWTPGSDIRQHIDYIKQKANVWYVGFGHLYMYRYVQAKPDEITVSKINGSDGSKGDNVFAFFDDFEDSDKNLLKWNLGSVQHTEVGGELKVDGASGGGSKSNYNSISFNDKIIEYGFKVDNIAGEATDFGYTSGGVTTDRKWLVFVGSGGRISVFSTQNNTWAARASSPTGIITTGTYYNLKLSDTGDQIRVELFNSDWSTKAYDSGFINRDTGGSYFHIYNQQNVTWYMDNFRIREYASTEPSISVGLQTSAYPNDSPSVYPSGSTTQAFTSLSGFSEAATKNGGEIKYQISNDGGATWYWYDSDWTTTESGYVEANTASEINTNITSLPVGSGQFLFRAFFISDGTQLIQLDSIILTHVSDTPASISPPVTSKLAPPGPPTCGEQAPTSAPWLYGASARGNSSILLQFSQSNDPVSEYVVEYGTESGNYQFAMANIGGKGTTSYLVQDLLPNTTYYFRVRAGNGCATGSWSNEISARTQGWLSSFVSRPLETQVIDTETDDKSDKSDEPHACQTYTVQTGETLSSIANELFGDATRYTELIELNSERYPVLQTDSSSIETGWELIIVSCDELEEDKSTDPRDAIGQVLGVNVKLKVVDKDKKPVAGAKVTLYSTPREATTNKDGIALFEGVEPGEHRAVIAYKDQSGEQKINVPDIGEVGEIDFTIQITPTSPFSNSWVMVVIGALSLGFVVLLILLFRSRRNS